MQHTFNKIGLFAKHNSRAIVDTFEKIISFLSTAGCELSIEKQSASLLSSTLQKKFKIVDRETLGQGTDLVIVVGGDGSFLNAARAVVPFGVPMLGVNRGRLGFLTDILPEEIEKDLKEILEGQYNQEQRILISAKIERDGEYIQEGDALNDVVLFGGSLARMIEFEVYINEDFVLRQLSDGFIVATPTGSTAYALSGGGPILYPALKAFSLVPMLPHMLTSRPIVVEESSRIELRISRNNQTPPKLSCDGQLHFDLQAGDRVHIEKYPKTLTLIHPSHYDYYAVLRQKLGWNIVGKMSNNQDISATEK
jgi:NAD+ kinase